eukprot:m.179834 g.179834  ORF g.179834 m.179834 type:complete len:177 (+) comp31989_c3_seq12:159-689(+)
MGQGGSKVVVSTTRPVIAPNKTRIHVAGFGMSHHTKRAADITREIVKTYPDRYESWFMFDGMNPDVTYRPDHLRTIKESFSQEQQSLIAAHKSSPFCWLEKPGTADGESNTLTPIGGRDDLCEWALKEFELETNGKEAIVQLASNEPRLLGGIFVDRTPGTANVLLTPTDATADAK